VQISIVYLLSATRFRDVLICWQKRTLTEEEVVPFHGEQGSLLCLTTPVTRARLDFTEYVPSKFPTNKLFIYFVFSPRVYVCTGLSGCNHYTRRPSYNRYKAKFYKTQLHEAFS